MLFSSRDFTCHCKTWQGMELPQLITLREEILETHKNSFNFAQLQLWQYMSTLCWIALIITLHKRWLHCLKDLKYLFTRKLKQSPSDKYKLVLEWNVLQDTRFWKKHKIQKWHIIAIIYNKDIKKSQPTILVVAKNHIAVNVRELQEKYCIVPFWSLCWFPHTDKWFSQWAL